MGRIRLQCAAVAAFALLGVLLVRPGLASAIEPTAICSKAESGCAEANLYANETGLTGTSTNLKVETELGTVACASAGLGGTTEADYGYSLPIEISSLSFTTCKLGATSCTVKAPNLPYTGWLEAAGTESSFEIEERSGGVMLEVTCGAVVCKYAAGEPSLSVSTSGTLQLTATKLFLESLTPLCGKKGSLSATYAVKAGGGGNVLPVELLGARVKLLPKNPPARGKPLEIELGKTEEVTVKNETKEVDFAVVVNGALGNFKVGATTCAAELKAAQSCADTVEPLAGAMKKDKGQLIAQFQAPGVVRFKVTYRLRAK